MVLHSYFSICVSFSFLVSGGSMALPRSDEMSSKPVELLFEDRRKMKRKSRRRVYLYTWTFLTTFFRDSETANWEFTEPVKARTLCGAVEARSVYWRSQPLYDLPAALSLSVSEPRRRKVQHEAFVNAFCPNEFTIGALSTLNNLTLLFSCIDTYNLINPINS